MAARIKYPYKTSILILHEHPTDVVNVNPLDNTNDGATCSFKVYDHAKEESFSADEAIDQDVWSVTGPASFKVGDQVEATQDDDSLHVTTVTAIDAAAGTIEVADPLTVAAAEGNRVRCRLGNEITMTEYGTPAVGTIDWGFRGPLASDHPGLEISVEIDVEITFVGSGSGGLDALDVICAVIKPREDCSEFYS